MNFIQKFFQVDIPATFSAGKLRIRASQLKSRLSQLDKQRAALLSELGAKAWEGRVKDPRYDAVYARLEEVDVSIAATKQETETVQRTVDEASAKLNGITGDFNARSKEIQDQKGPAVQALSDVRARQKSIEQRLNQLQSTVSQGRSNVQNMQAQVDQFLASSQPDKDARVASLQSTIATITAQVEASLPQIESAKAELETAKAAEKPIKDEIDGFDQLIKMLQEQFRSAAAPIQEDISKQQKRLAELSQKQTSLSAKVTAQFPELGTLVYKFRPSAEALSPAYGQLDTAEGEARSVNDELNLINVQLGSASSSVRNVLLAGGAVLLIGLCVVGAAVALPDLLRRLEPDPKSDVRLVKSWTLGNCAANGAGGSYSDISVWENRGRDATATAGLEVKLIGSNDVVLDTGSGKFPIGPGGSMALVANLDPRGSRVQSIGRSVTSVTFNTYDLGRLPQVDIESFFEKSQYSDNISLGLEITNKSDFGLRRDDDAPYVLVVNSQDEIIDVLEASLRDSELPVDSRWSVSFSRRPYYAPDACLQDDYSRESVTFWYFVPLQLEASNSDHLSLSGKVRYSP